MPCSASRRSLTFLHLSGSPTITGTMYVSPGVTGMKPGALFRHISRGTAEALYAVEGDFTNEGEQYSQALRCTFKAGREHGPHATNKA